MTVTATMYGKAGLHLGNGDINFGANTFKVALTTSSYTPDTDAHEFFSSVTNEVSGTGYTAGGATLSTVAWAYDATNHWTLLSADPATWTAPTFTTRRAVVYKSTGSSATSILICYVDFGADQSPGGVDFTINWSNGLVRAYGV